MTGDSLGELASGGSRRIESWPTWSPDGRWIAFGRLSVSGGNLNGAGIVLIGSDGQTERPMALPSGTAPIYLSWSPDSRYLTALVQQRDSLALQLADVSEDQPALRPAVESGAPLFSSWSPDSSTLLVHVNGDRRMDARARLSRLSVRAGSEAQPLPMAPSSFNTPAWSPDGRDWAFAAGIGDKEDGLYLRQGDQSSLLARGFGPAFVWAPRGRQLAYGARISEQDDFSTGLWVTDGSGPGTQVVDDALVAFFWAPDGRRLAYFSPGPAGLTLLSVDSSGKNKRSLASFAPTQDFAQLMSFFDQYAQSHTVWSPDSQRVLFAGVRASGNGSSNNPHVFAAAADGSGVQQVADGSIAFWSQPPPSS